MAARKKKQFTVNLADFDTYTKACEGVDLIINMPDSEEPFDVTGNKDYVTVTVYGTDSPQFRKARGRMMSRLLALKQTKDEVSEEDADMLDIEFAAACVKGWKNVIFNDEEGELSELEFSEENVKKIFLVLPWLKEQVVEYITNRSNFSKR